MEPGPVSSSMTQSPPQGVSAGLSADGPATVLNPGMQGQLEQGSSIPANVDSEVLRRLFPSVAQEDGAVRAVAANGFQLDHFKIEEQIGRGGMGAVFRAMDERLDRVVALKVLSPRLCGDAATVYRFRNEAKAAAKLDHENIARVHYTGVDRGVPFIAFEYVTGINLRQMILERGRLDPAEVVNYTLQIAAALRHTNAAGVVHRDIKPSNIIITPSGRAKLVDLGLARKEYSESAPELTVAGTTLGTFDYISPEQAKDPRNVDVRSDIYSLGCTVYHMLTGEPPYPEGTVIKKLLDRQDKAPPNPSSRAPGIPSALAEIVMTMMAGRPHARQASPDVLINDLMLVASQLKLRGVHPEGLVWKTATQLNSRRFVEKHFVWVIGGLLLLGLAFAMDRFTRPDPADRNQTASEPSDRGAVSGNTRNQKTDDGQPRQKTSQQAVLKKKIGKPEIIPRSVLSDAVWRGVAQGAGALSAVGVAAKYQLTRTDTTHPGPIDPGGHSKVADGKKKKSTGSATTGTRRNLITILDESGGQSKSYPTLEAACAAAQNGQVVLLRFNGIRRDNNQAPVVDRPLKVVNKSITLRPAAGFKPVLMFSGEKFENSDPVTRMIVVANGSVSVNNVGFVLKVNESLAAGDDARWSLFALQKTDRVHLNGVHVTIDNPNDRYASLFEITESRARTVKGMKVMMKKRTEVTESFDLKLTNCFVCGRCDVFTIPLPRPGEVNVGHSAFVVAQSLFRISGGELESKPDIASRIDIKLEHVTSVTGRGLADVDVAGTLPGSVLPIRVSARNCLFSSRTMQPLIAMSGGRTLGDLRQLLRWSGEKNFYDRYDRKDGRSVMWRLQSDDSTMQPQSMSFEDWQTFWGKTGDVDPHQGGVVWKHDWSTIKAIATTPAKLRLDTNADASSNPAASGASDGGAVGADIEKLPVPYSTSNSPTIDSSKS